MREYVCIVGLDEPEAQAIKEHLEVPAIAHVTIPRIMLKDGELWAELPNSPRYVKISSVIYHGIYEDDLDFITALALWGGDCLPNPRAMMDCRLKFPCLVRALAHTCFGSMSRGYASPWVHFDTDEERVAKWGNWHCGENKERFTGLYQVENPSIVEQFIDGQAVRVVLIGDQAWQIRLEGDDWLKSIHHDSAEFMPLDDELLADTQHIRAEFGLEIMANDYMIAHDGTKHLLEVNHIPNVTRFPEIWEAYHAFVLDWLAERHLS